MAPREDESGDTADWERWVGPQIFLTSFLNIISVVFFRSKQTGQQFNHDWEIIGLILIVIKSTNQT